MGLDELKGILEAVFPTAYWEFPKGKAPKMPYICFFENYSTNFGADNVVYHPRNRISVELYTQKKSREAESKLEAAFLNAELFWNKDETVLEDENCYEVIYTLEV